MTKPSRPIGRAAKALAEPLNPDLDYQIAQLMPTIEEIQDRVFTRVVELAMRDDEFRRRVAQKMKDLGEGRPRRGATQFDLMQVATAAELLTLNFGGSRRDGHRVKIPRLFDEIAAFLNIPPGAAKRRYYAAKKAGFRS